VIKCKNHVCILHASVEHLVSLLIGLNSFFVFFVGIRVLGVFLGVLRWLWSFVLL
jgi:hypothetical protein